MRISRRKKKPEIKRSYHFNEGIRVAQVFVLDEEGNSLGLQNTAEAIRSAREKELDLVIINPKADPPIAKMTDYGQFKYQREKEDRKKKAKQHITDTKGVRLSVRIGSHDLDIRRNQTIKFLDSGNKVKIEIILRGRENNQVGLGFEVMKKFIESVNDLTPVRVEQEVDKQGNKITSLIAKQ